MVNKGTTMEDSHFKDEVLVSVPGQNLVYTEVLAEGEGDI